MAKGSDEKSHRDNDGLHKRRGIWYFTLNIDGERRFFSTKTRNWQEARKIRAEAVKAQLDNRLPTELAKWPFQKLLAQVMEDRKPHLADNSIRIDRERSVPLLRAFSGQRVSDVADPAVIRAWQAKRLKQVSPRTVNLEAKLLRSVFKAARVWSAIVDDYKALPENRRGPGRALTEEQERVLFDTARQRPAWDAAFLAALVSANTTARGGELKALRVGDVDLIERQLTIRRSKTNAGRRDIPLNGAAVWAFARLIERASALGSVERDHFLFPAFLYRKTKSELRGTGYDPTRPQKTWRTAWRSLVKHAAKSAGKDAAKTALAAGDGIRGAIKAWRRASAGIRGMRFHDLRHLSVTKLAESGASDSTIMAIAGHMDRAMLEHYSHIRAAAKRQAVDAIRSYMPDELEPETTAAVISTRVN